MVLDSIKLDNVCKVCSPQPSPWVQNGENEEVDEEAGEKRS